MPPNQRPKHDMPRTPPGQNPVTGTHGMRLQVPQMNHTPTLAGSFSLHKTSPEASTDKAQGTTLMYAATQKPSPQTPTMTAMASQIQYHTPAAAGAFSHETPMQRMHLGEILECAQPHKTSTLDYLQYNDATHLPKWVPPLCDTPPNEWVCGNTWCLLPPWPSPQIPATDMTLGKAPSPLQKITPETGWATV
ncbi:hypothetical protein BS47DRAFT_1357719 [Hydnum rufescens UP504]|uniref:Uncharacterized protein n=1 Tax=Hydnum rufescens UP504 TaxID=1448309 RepID=A0A9P6B9D4_9AGAM|nr:hypothetical protein BS47DRAFT_1357719 [Hydnum rufescens UP504]